MNEFFPQSNPQLFALATQPHASVLFHADSGILQIPNS
jgi:hypothetical protein